jgi:hypothetical protein
MMKDIRGLTAVAARNCAFYTVISSRLNVVKDLK